MSSKAAPRAGINLPANWAVSSLIIHYEGEDLSKDPAPFAANIGVQLRIDTPRGASPADVAASDVAALKAGIQGFQILGRGELTVGKHTHQHFEFTYLDAQIGTLQQLVILVHNQGRIYSIAGTHVAGERFAAVRDHIIEFAATFFAD